MARTVRGCCPLDCPDTCSWDVDVDDAGKPVALRGVREHPFTRGALCGKVNRYLDLVQDPGRLLHPMRRVGAKGEGRFERISWDEALDLVADGLSRARADHGGESILPYSFAGTMGLVQGTVMSDRLMAALGTSQLARTICTAAAKSALRSTVGTSVGPDPEDMVHARLVVLWGANLLAANVHQWRFVLEARARGAYVVAIDPLRTETAERCDEHVAPLPGTDGALALGLMRAVVDLGAHDENWLERHADGWPELARRLDEWPVERAAATCGLDVATVQALGERLARTRPTFIRVGLGLQRHGGAGAAMRSIIAISAVTGDWRHVGGGCLSMTSGFFPLAKAERLPGAGRPTTRVVNMSRLGEALLDLDDPPVRALVVYNANPAASNPDQRRVHEGLLREDLFTVVLEQRPTDTTDFADVLLPATMQPEHLDLHTTYGHQYLALNQPALEPPGECLPNSEIFRRLAARLGLDHPALRDSDEEIVRQLLDLDEARRQGATLDALTAEGFVRIGPPRGVAPYADGGFPTPTGRLQLRDERLAAVGADPLVGYVPPHEVADEQLASRFPLVLLSPASRFFLNSTFAGSGWHRGKTGPPVVYLHPDDAAARGLGDGDRARVFNDRGAFEAQVTLSDATRPGVAFTRKQHWVRHSAGGMNVNATTPERDADLGGAPTFHDNRVEVARPG
jgi:anaerobic selenocysteine-containing dehydrogenase